MAAVKIAAHWLTTGLPLTLLSPLLGTMFGLSLGETETLVLSLLIGTPSVSALGAIGAALTLSIRRGGLILPLLVLPLLAPAVIFGAAAVQAGPSGLSGGALLLLSAFSVATTLPSPFAAAAAVRLNLAG
jgi:heme exporter protein B